MSLKRTLAGAAFFLALASSSAFAHEGETHDGAPTPARADGHAPIGVMGDHMHNAGEWMIGYRYMTMSMSDPVLGDENVSPDWIVTNMPNRFFGMPGQPPTLRVVPLEMDMSMHMAGVMYAPTDWVTLIASTSYVEKEMTAVTYAGMMGTTRLGTFSMDTGGWGDSRITAAFRLYQNGNAHVQFNAGLSLPTGSITERVRVLSPMGTWMNMRAAYGMQLGTGTYDVRPSLTYTDRANDLSWGAQYSGALRFDENDEGYTWGDEHQVTGWLAYQFAPWISASSRLTARTQESIDGIDPNIMGPTQGADPDNYGGDHVDLSFGVNLIGQSGVLFDHRLAAEVSLPLHSDVNGLQLERDWALTIGYQKAF